MNQTQTERKNDADKILNSIIIDYVNELNFLHLMSNFDKKSIHYDTVEEYLIKTLTDNTFKHLYVNYPTFYRAIQFLEVYIDISFVNIVKNRIYLGIIIDSRKIYEYNKFETKLEINL